MANMMKRIKIYGTVILAILFLIVLMQNAEAVSVRFLVWKFSVSQVILLPLVLALGFAIGWLVGEFRRPRE